MRLEGNDVTTGQRLLVVGTSNSLRRGGYAEFLGRVPSVQLLNVSIGASTSIHSIWRTSAVDFAQHDAALLDFAVNEDVMLRGGAISPSSIRPILTALICRATAAQCMPVVLILPRQQPVASLARPFYLEIAREFGLPVLDGYSVVEHLAETAGIPTEVMFDDAAHVTSWVSALIAEILQEGVRRLLSRPARWRKLDWASPRLKVVDVTGQGSPSTKLVERATSRFSGRFLRLDGPNRIELQVEPNAHIIGIRLNLRETNAFLRLKADGEVAMDLRNSYYQSDRYPAVISAFPLPAPLPATAEHVVIESLSERPQDGDVSDASGELGTSGRPATGEVEIADLFIQSAELLHSGFMSALDDAERDLFDADAKDRCRLALAIYRSFNSQEKEAALIAAFEERRLKKRAARKAARSAVAR